MPLPENAQAIQTILEVLNPRILGQERPGWSCCCGSIKGAAATAVQIMPAGDQYPGQESMWFLWSVKMQPKSGETGTSWSCGISDFVPSEELQTLFVQHFGEAAR